MSQALSACLLIGVCAISFAQTPSQQRCDKDELLVKIQYGFKDIDAQAPWVYRSLKPSISFGSEILSPVSDKIEDGAEKMDFCAKKKNASTTHHLKLHVGPRTIELYLRPVVNGPDGQATMTDMLLLNQPRPNWVIVQSIERLNRTTDQLPAYDISIFNFGPPHSGGRVMFRATDLSSSCFAGSPPESVEVQVSLTEQILKVSSADPEYPETPLSRTATLETGIASCASNFHLTADLGPTGRLSAGPNRIRYIFKEARSSASQQSLLRFFSSGNVSVKGDDIW